MSKLGWYYHRLRAMSAAEMAAHLRKKLRQSADAKGLPDFSAVNLGEMANYPTLPQPADAPPEVRAALRRDADAIQGGHWSAFGHLDLRVDDPPKWHKDYLAGQDLATTRSAFQLNHRELPPGADIKLVWELSRWYPLTRLAMAAFVLGDERAARKCLAWLVDWHQHNPPYIGWNWTSALEAGMRLIQFTWIDALLSAAMKLGVAADESPKLARLRRDLLPPHVWFCSRYQSFGSSANNHLLGELTGLILATARWPELEKIDASLAELHLQWEYEVLAQFAPDGGNREQALNYQLFSWEFCWHARAALRAAKRAVKPDVSLTLLTAATFLTTVQTEEEPWDYGDSDSAHMLPFFVAEATAGQEWRSWMIQRGESAGIEYWQGATRDSFTTELSADHDWINTETFDLPLLAKVFPLPPKDPQLAWLVFPDSGQAVCRAGRWTLRWDLSPLGYLNTAAHGHLDALHLSLWLDGHALVIDPGTGAYYADKSLRAWLASRSAHNSPCPAGPEWPRRLGPFLWEQHHRPPSWHGPGQPAETTLAAKFDLPGVSFERTVTLSPDQTRCEVTDQVASGATAEFSVRWQFAPGSVFELLAERKLRVTREGVSIEVEAGMEWAGIHVVSTNDPRLLKAAAENDAEAQLAGTVSSAFRHVEWAPFMKLVARPRAGQSCVFRTTFLLSPAAFRK
ncbi:MAG TPA: heparinase II/III-family protein [Verrucomicrobiae bacterium]|nr:heparinase II/III-family protein [Verrucomicrobiae bacterium]